MAEKPKNMNEWAEANAYVGFNLNKIADILSKMSSTLDKINWNLGNIANPNLKNKYPETEAKLGHNGD